MSMQMVYTEEQVYKAVSEFILSETAFEVVLVELALQVLLTDEKKNIESALYKAIEYMKLVKEDSKKYITFLRYSDMRTPDPSVTLSLCDVKLRGGIDAVGVYIESDHSIKESESEPANIFRKILKARLKNVDSG